MKNIYNKFFIGGLFVSSFLVACSKNFLDRENTSGIVTTDLIWTSSNAIQALLVSMYDEGLNLDEFDDWYGSKANLQNQTSLSDEAQGSYQKDYAFSNASGVYTYSDYLFNDAFKTRYIAIRRANDFILRLAEATVITEDLKKELNAEVRFIRAMEYFALVKRYGGVPLLTVPQVYENGNTDTLQVPRNTEAETYDFIINECKAIADSLPITRAGSEKYRATKGAALALCSRAALYAGSIAKYSPTLTLSGTAVTQGIVCIPSGNAEHFFTESYNASKELLALGVYSLYDKNTDKAQNFYDLFSKTVNGDNGEYIFQKQYNVAGGYGHMWDKMNAPFSYRGDGWGCGMSPNLEMVEEFEYTDGSDGKLKIKDDNGTPISYTSPYDLFANKDPRLFGSIYLPGSPCKGSTMEWIRGIIDGQNGSGQKYQAQNQPSGDNTVTINGVKYNASGKDGGADVGDASKTSFYQKKFFDETLTDMTNIDAKRSSTPWVVFRLAEIYLNLAEASMELGGKDAEALDAVNMIRNRAGVATLTNITLEKVRHERKVELAFEKLRYWDLKRWRIAHLDVSQGGLTNFRGTALYPWYNLKSGKYTFETGIPPKQARLFLEKNYYVRIGSEEISANPKLIQNPGYAN